MAIRLERAFPWLLLPVLLTACSESGRPSPASASASGLIELPAFTVEVPRMTGGMAQPQKRGDAFRRGLSIGPIEAPENDEDFKRKYGQLLDRAVALGVTDLQLVVRWLQVDYSAVEVAPFESVHDELLTWVIDGARRRKLRVLLTPRLEVENEGLNSGGAVEPRNWEHWWWSYHRVALHYAKVSQMRKLQSYAIGDRLTSSEGQSERWRALIKEARKSFHGELTYVASAESVEKVGFWDALDTVTVAVDQAQPKNEDQLTDKLAQLTRKLSKSKVRSYQVVETGCGRGDPSAARELLCTFSLFQGLRDEPELSGVYLQAPSDVIMRATRGEQPNPSASDVISHWYKHSR